MSAISLIQESINEAIEHNQPVGNLSDGYHTFNDLYKHRIELFKTLCRVISEEGIYQSIWKSRRHSDGSILADWFIMGIFTAKGEQVTYHLPMSEWPNCEFAETKEFSPEWDGHTSADVLKRLAKL